MSVLRFWRFSLMYWVMQSGHSQSWSTSGLLESRCFHSRDWPLMRWVQTMLQGASLWSEHLMRSWLAMVCPSGCAI